MATHLSVTATHDGSVDNHAVREALRGVEISVSSPIDSAARLSTAHDVDDSGEEPSHRVHVRSGDRDAEFTKKTTDAITSAISAIDGVTDVAVDGGYDGDSDAEDETGGGD